MPCLVREYKKHKGARASLPNEKARSRAGLHPQDPDRPGLRRRDREPARSRCRACRSGSASPVRLKREDLQPVFSFKLRGAYNKMVGLPREALERGVICASAGNHAQGVALAAQRLGAKATIVMPRTTPAIKVQAVKGLGGRVVLHGDSFDEAYAHARQLEAEKGLTFIHPYDDPDVIAGQGTVGMEILRQHPDPIEAVFVPIGGGGLAAGIAVYVKFLRPEVKVIGVEPDDAASMAAAIAAGERVILDQVGLFADGVAVRQAGEETFRLCRELLDEVITVEHRRDLRGGQGHLRGHPRHRRALRRRQPRRAEEVCGAGRSAEPTDWSRSTAAPT